MQKDGRLLNIVDEEDNIIGIKTREEIHELGLRHRETHVWFINKDGVFFQHRAKDKDSYPDMLDATVGGHVEIGDDYIKTALKEMMEETGIKKEKKDLFFIDKLKKEYFDDVTGVKNNAFRKVYFCEFLGSTDDLKLEKGKISEFIFITWEKLVEKNKITKKIIPVIHGELLSFYKEGKFDLIIKK